VTDVILDEDASTLPSATCKATVIIITQISCYIFAANIRLVLCVTGRRNLTVKKQMHPLKALTISSMTQMLTSEFRMHVGIFISGALWRRTLCIIRLVSYFN